MDEPKIRQRMEQVLQAVREDVASIRTGRATPSLVENIKVAAYEGTQELKLVELAMITAEDAQTLLIQPWDKATINEIKKAIEQEKIGLTPTADGDVLRIKMPPMTAEDRENYIRVLNQKLENGRVMVRQIRQEAMQGIRDAFENKEFSEDDKILQEKKVQEITDEYTDRIEQAGKAKEEELRSV